MKISYFLIGFGILALMFSLARVYYLLWLQRKERQLAMERARETLRKLHEVTVQGRTTDKD